MDGTQSLDRALTLLNAVVTDDGRTPVAMLAAELGLMASSARRMVTALKRQGLIEQIAHGRYAGGEQLLALAKAVSPHRRLMEVARPRLRHLAQKEGWTAHLGYFDNEMVTYLIKEGDEGLFTREGAQLEAYCTGIGKALLAQLSPLQLSDYLSGPFIRLTDSTICSPSELRESVQQASLRGFAIDDREMSEAVSCVAVPLPAGDDYIAAISLSGDANRFPLEMAERMAGRLHVVAETIAEAFLKIGEPRA